jgi:hypothetical protein
MQSTPDVSRFYDYGPEGVREAKELLFTGLFGVTTSGVALSFWENEQSNSVCRVTGNGVLKTI